jgi:hypothetical protein
MEWVFEKEQAEVEAVSEFVETSPPNLKSTRPFALPNRFDYGRSQQHSERSE